MSPALRLAPWRRILPVVASCAWLGQSACAHTATPFAGPGGETVLAQVGDAPLREADLPEATQAKLFALDNGYAQQRYVTLWTGVEDAIGDKLLEAEAQRRHQPVTELLAKEVEAKAGVVTDAELHEIYNNNQARIGVPYAQAAPYLREQALNERAQTLRRALVDRLRAHEQVTLSLPLLELRRVAVADDPLAPNLGPKDAPVTLVLFTDFQCPYSAQARRLVKKLSELYPKALRINSRQYPLEQHSFAARAAEAALCAHAQGKYWPMYEQLFENTAQLSEAGLGAYAEAAGLDAAAFAACLKQGQGKQGVQRDVLEGRALGLKGTPAMYLNGMPLQGVLPLPVMQALIERERDQAGDK